MNILNKVFSIFQSKAVVLMYHRIASPAVDPWQLCVSRLHFDEQIKILKQHFNVISVEELAEQLKKKQLKHKSVCVTFDDGYADNYISARPVLEKYNCPATFFIAANYIGSQQLFWWDLLQHIILGSATLPAQLELDIAATVFKYNLTDTVLSEKQLADQAAWQWPQAIPNDRCRLYLSIWERLLPLDYTDIKPVLEQLVSWAAYADAAQADEVPMTNEQLRQLSAGNLFSLGVHTLSHAALPFHNASYQFNELNHCKVFLNSNFSNTVNAVAYPYGRSNGDTIAASKKAGIDAGFTTSGNVIKKNSDILTLGRMQVCNWNGNDFHAVMKSWFN